MKILRLIPVLALLGAIGFLAVHHVDRDDDGTRVITVPAGDRSEAPSMTWKDDADKSAVSLESLRGKVVLVNLWATWCGPCISEMPELDVLAQRLGGDHFLVATIAMDQPPTVVRRYLSQAKLRALPVYTGESSKLPANVLPTSMIIDSAGRIAWQGVGRRPWLAPEVETTLRALIAEGG